MNVILGVVVVLVIIEASYVKVRQNGDLLSSKKSLNQEVLAVNYNVFFKNKDKAALVDKITQQNADILTIQELTPEWERFLKLKLNYPYFKGLALRGTHGIGIFSRFPLSNVEYVYNNSKLPIAQIVDLNVNGTVCCIANAHLASPAIAVENPDRFFSLIRDNYQLRKSQYAKIQNRINARSAQAKLLIGDLNTTCFEPLYNQIKMYWNDGNSFPRLSIKRNFPNSNKFPPLFTLDYILSAGNTELSKYEVIPGGSSDHLGIRARVKL
ncbi:MAG: endonuclease/exonuclease/phosphatase family protein [Flavobacteriales bacterium]|nr:endonuclease/exonuclease/phosphatase family protein [Flavobacteriales bacterium]